MTAITGVSAVFGAGYPKADASWAIGRPTGKPCAGALRRLKNGLPISPGAFSAVSLSPTSPIIHLCKGRGDASPRRSLPFTTRNLRVASSTTGGASYEGRDPLRLVIAEAYAGTNRDANPSERLAGHVRMAVAHEEPLVFVISNLRYGRLISPLVFNGANSSGERQRCPISTDQPARNLERPTVIFITVRAFVIDVIYSTSVDSKTPVKVAHDGGISGPVSLSVDPTDEAFGPTTSSANQGGTWVSVTVDDWALGFICPSCPFSLAVTLRGSPTGNPCWYSRTASPSTHGFIRDDG